MFVVVTLQPHYYTALWRALDGGTGAMEQTEPPKYGDANGEHTPDAYRGWAG
jgi:hypothetical protein